MLDDLYWLQVLKNRGSQFNEGSRFIKLLILQSVKFGKVEKFYSSFKLLSISDRNLDECSDSEYLDNLSERKLEKFSWIAPALVTVIKTCDLPMDATICQIISLVFRILFLKSSQNSVFRFFFFKSTQSSLNRANLEALFDEVM